MIGKILIIQSPQEVCLAHLSINVCRHGGKCVWSEDPFHVEIINAYQEGVIEPRTASLLIVFHNRGKRPT